MLIDDAMLIKNKNGKIVTDKPTLWHCHDSRSLRALWTLDEMGIDYDVVTMQFPPRINQPNYKEMNILGTVPYFVDGETHMTESSGICQYLVEKYQHQSLRINIDHPEYGDYINWLFMSDATLLFPQTLILRYSRFEPKQRRLPQVVDDYTQWFLARLKKLDQHMIDRLYLCDDRFTIADIAIGYALYLGDNNGLSTEYSPHIKSYLLRLKQRPAFKRIIHIGEELSPFKHPQLWTMKK